MACGKRLFTEEHCHDHRHLAATFSTVHGARPFVGSTSFAPFFPSASMTTLMSGHGQSPMVGTLNWQSHGISVNPASSHSFTQISCLYIIFIFHLKQLSYASQIFLWSNKCSYRAPDLFPPRCRYPPLPPAIIVPDIQKPRSISITLYSTMQSLTQINMISTPAFCQLDSTFAQLRRSSPCLGFR